MFYVAYVAIRFAPWLIFRIRTNGMLTEVYRKYSVAIFEIPRCRFEII